MPFSISFGDNHCRHCSKQDLKWLGQSGTVLMDHCGLLAHVQWWAMHQNKLSFCLPTWLIADLGFLLLFSKLTDIFGQNTLLIVAQLIFLVFSMACGAAQTMTQLYGSMLLCARMIIIRYSRSHCDLGSSSEPYKVSEAQESIQTSLSLSPKSSRRTKLACIPAF